jgi:hypothetical protein
MASLSKWGAMLHLVRDYVTAVLNGGDSASIPRLFSENYRDHDPPVIPALGLAPTPGWGTRRDIQMLCKALHRPGVDLVFVLEDVFQAGDRIGYRMFGSGSLLRGTSGYRAPADTSKAKHKAVSRPEYVSIQVTGIFRVAHERLAERWGVPAMRQE